MTLKEYRRKRKFNHTPEPDASAKIRPGKGLLRFVVQKHLASREHYDFRLEFDGTLKSWAVPKGPSLTSQQPRLALHVEDHPIDYGSFEGTIPRGNYGAGTVMIWDWGTYVERNSQGRKDSEKALRKGLENGHITFVLHGKKLRGEFALVRIKRKGAPPNGWLLIKKHDAEATRADVLLQDRSVATGRTLDEIENQAEARGEIWLPGKGRKGTRTPSYAKNKPRKVIPPRVKPKTRSEKPVPIPRTVKAMEPVFATSAPGKHAKDEWVFENFGRGSRALAEVDKASARLFSKSHLPFAKKYSAITEALKKLNCEVILDGEIVIDGKKETYFISDLLFQNGKDLRPLPLKERKKALSRMKFSFPLQLTPWKTDYAALDTLPPPCVIVAKRNDSSYHSGLSKDWLRFRSKSFGTPAEQSSERPALTHLDKIFWPEEKYTKGDLVHYYESIADFILPYMVDRPQSLHRQPDGLKNDGFFHKDMASFLPRRMQTVRVYSASSGKTVNYVLCQDRWALLYLVNLGCIEFNPWLSRQQNLEHPDLVVIDLDPDGNDFREVVKVALEVHRLLNKIKADSYCKTSGASGLHICIPTGGKFDYDTGRLFAEAVCNVIHLKLPSLTSVERNPAKRKGRIYLDFLQNRRGQTLAAAYCVRPRPKATVSTPLKWSEVKASLRPEQFTIKTMARRLARVGDLWKPLLSSAVDIEACMKRLSKL